MKRLLLLTLGSLAFTAGAQSLSNLNLHALLLERARTSPPAPLPFVLQSQVQSASVASSTFTADGISPDGYGTDTNAVDEDFNQTYVFGLLPPDAPGIWPINHVVDHVNGSHSSWFYWTNPVPILYGDVLRVWWPTSVLAYTNFAYTNWQMLLFSNIQHTAYSSNDVITLASFPSGNVCYGEYTVNTNSGFRMLALADPCIELFGSNYWQLSICHVVTNSSLPPTAFPPTVPIWVPLPTVITNLWPIQNLPQPLFPPPYTPPWTWPGTDEPTKLTRPGVLGLIGPDTNGVTTAAAVFHGMPNSTYAVSNSPSLDAWGSCVTFTTSSNGWGGFVFSYTNASMFFKLNLQ